MQKMPMPRGICPQQIRPEARELWECRLLCAWPADVSLRSDLTDTLSWNRYCPPANLNAAYKQVMRNKGAAGIDRMDCGRLLGYLLGSIRTH